MPQLPRPLPRRPWWESYFGDDYFVLYKLDDAATERECDFVCQALGLCPAMRVLDLGCGYGRHVCRLRARQLHVVGLDLEPAQLGRARARLEARGLGPDLVRGDMRMLPFGSAFDAAISMFTAFGYFDDEGNLQVLREVRDVLRDGGRLLLDLPNAAFFWRWGPRSQWVEREGAKVLEMFERDAAGGRLISRKILFRGGDATEYRFSLREYTFPELRALLAEAGFDVEAVWGGFDGCEFSDHSRRMIVRARRSGG